jgi:hypothetical protein
LKELRWQEASLQRIGDALGGFSRSLGLVGRFEDDAPLLVHHVKQRLLVDGLTPAFAQCSHREVVLELRDGRPPPITERNRQMLGIGQLDVDSREVERIILDRELVIAVREEAGQTAMPVKCMEQLDTLTPDLPHLEREKVEEEASGISREPERVSAAPEPVSPGRERRNAKLAVNRAMIDADLECKPALELAQRHAGLALRVVVAFGLDV